MKFRCLAAVYLVLIATSANILPAAGSILLPSTYGSNMVLKHSTPQTFWGIAGKGDKVTLTISDKSYSETTPVDPDTGRFSFVLPSHPPTKAGDPVVNITVSSSSDGAVSLTDAVWGEVILCGGQSNMAISVQMAMNASWEIEHAGHPNLRLLQVANLDSFARQSTPLENTTMSLTWSKSAPDTVPLFSAVCYYTGVNVLDSILDDRMPLGLIESCWGGTPIETWMPPSALEKCGKGEHRLNKQRMQLEIKTRDMLSHMPPYLRKAYHLGGPHTPSALYNAMIHPLLNTRISGVLWYQAESNVGPPPAAAQYADCFKELILDWRSEFAGKAPSELKLQEDADFGFVFVQISDWPYDGDQISEMRFAQTAALALPKTGMVVAADIGDVASPNNNIHPDNKQEVGRRASYVFDGVVFGNDKTTYRGPRPIGIKASNWHQSWGNFHSGTGEYGYCNLTTVVRCVGIVINFDQNVYSRRLLNPQMRSGFELWVGTLWQPVSMTGVINETAIQLNVTADAGFPRPLRYGWGMYPYMHLYNDLEFPVAPFNITIDPQ